MRGNLDKVMTEREVFAGEAAFFGTEDEGDTALVGEFGLDEWREVWQRNDWLFGFAVSKCPSAEDKGAIGDGFAEGIGFAGGLEQVFGADGGLSFAPVWLVGVNDSEMGEAEVGHGASGRSNIERVARRDEDDGEPGEMGLGRQELIVEGETGV